jgi:hypothetical protein
MCQMTRAGRRSLAGSSSASCVTAGAFGFLSFTHNGDRPERLGRAKRRSGTLIINGSQNRQRQNEHD